MLKRLCFILFTAAVLSISGCAIRTVITVDPPPAKEEVRPPAPHPKAVWIEGHWRWKGGQYVWVPGHWEKKPKGVWVPGHWDKKGKRHTWVPGHWKK